ncbi:MAG: hypothetical protein JXL97_17610 [Bacteroidales bacterium]|nr:hypothetical protein [Bacteroidales bacterium]
MVDSKFYKSDFTSNSIAHEWLFEFKKDNIVREIGIDKLGKTIITIPNDSYPNGLFGDSNIELNHNDLIEITENEFETKWKNKNTP